MASTIIGFDSTLAPMHKFITIFCCMCLALCLKAQMSDYISVKKRNGITIANYYPGWPIHFSTQTGDQVSGPIAKIRNDSVYIKFFQIIKQPTIWGTWIEDTVRTDIIPFHYTFIRQIFSDRKTRRKGHLKTLGNALQLGGGGYAVLNVVNTLRDQQPVFSAQNKSRLAIAAGTFIGGWLLNRQLNQYYRKPNKYKIVYVNMQ